MSKEVADLLRRAKAKIPTPETWTRGEFARDLGGKVVGGASAHAVCWCAYGAIQAVAHESTLREDAEDAIASQVPSGYVADFNDAPETTHADVLAAFDRAIAAEESAA